MANSQRKRLGVFPQDLSGLTFPWSQWTVLQRDSIRPHNWVCKCSCGTEKSIYRGDLINGKSKSCGCRPKTVTIQSTHGMSASQEYGVWASMKQRCSNCKCKEWKYYGARGIEVCNRWSGSFQEFFDDMGVRPFIGATIERKDNSLGYVCGKCNNCHTLGVFECNCRWATYKEQMRNKRSNRFVTFNGKTMTLIEWHEELGFKRPLLYSRLRIGWSIEKALTTPVEFRSPRK